MFNTNAITPVHIGRKAEESAFQFLTHRPQVRILQRNFRNRYGEIDIILEEANALVFLEVRHRKYEALVSALETVTPKKRLRLLKAAKIYLARYQGLAREIRFDLLFRDGESAWVWMRAAW